MAFVDEATIYAASGKGGDGVVRWLRTRENARGGPSGGDGGKGGDVILVGVRDLAALARYRHEKTFHAEDGEAGKSDLGHGANGADILLEVPIGTVARISETGEEYEITHEGQRVTLFKGGWGGKGNARFKSATHQNPFEHTDGKMGEGGEIVFTLKIIADVGIVGLPSAGKSSLLNALTRAKSKVGAYPFTTLEPHLGSFYGYILADIPGLIEGASDGRGLGVKFLKHVERTGSIVHLVSADQEDPLAAYREVRKELESFGHGICDKQEVVVLSQADRVSPEVLAQKVAILQAYTGKEVEVVSIEDADLLKSFSDRLTAILQARRGTTNMKAA